MKNSNNNSPLSRRNGVSFAANLLILRRHQAVLPCQCRRLGVIQQKVLAFGKCGGNLKARITSWGLIGKEDVVNAHVMPFKARWGISPLHLKGLAFVCKFLDGTINNAVVKVAGIGILTYHSDMVGFRKFDAIMTDLAPSVVDMIGRVNTTQRGLD